MSEVAHSILNGIRPHGVASKYVKPRSKPGLAAVGHAHFADDGRHLIADPLRYFVAAAKHEHLGRAAQELDISQPALSRSILRLESSLNIRLFDREGRGIRLNAAGRILLRRVAQAIGELEDAYQELSEIGTKAGRTISLGFLATLGARLIPDLIKRFKAVNPRAQFRLLQGPYPALRERLAKGEIDLCVSSPRFADPDLQWKPLFDEELRLLVPAGHRLAARSSVDLIEVSGEPIIALPKDFGLRQVLETLSRQAGFTPDIVFEGEEFSVLRGLVSAGFGVTLAPAGAVEHCADVVSLPILAPVCRRAVGISWRHGRYLSPTTRAFRDYLIEAFPQTPAST